MAAQLPVFALAPALVNNNILDYSTSTGQKIYKANAASLDIEFDLAPENLKIFLRGLEDRSMTAGWTDIMLVPPDLNDPDETVNILQHYGQLSLEQVQAHAQTYVNYQNRAAQDSMQLYQCIMSTLTKEAKAKIMLSSDQYTIDDLVAGICLLKVVISESYIDTNATTKFIRERLSSLDTYIISINSDIDKFNQHVKNQLDSLAARGESTQDLLSNLFKGYAAASDKEFKSYIAKKEDLYDEGENIDARTLMQLALNKYKTLCEGGRWNAPSEEEEKIIALEAEVKKLINKRDNTSKKTANNNSNAKSTSKKGKTNTKPDWMLIPPKPNESKTKRVNDKEYHWCAKHNAWGRHKQAECRGQGVQKGTNSSNTNNKAKPQQDEKKMQISKALAAIVEEDSDDHDLL